MSHSAPPKLPNSPHRERLAGAFDLLVSELNRASETGHCPVPNGVADSELTQALVVLVVRIAFIDTAERLAPSPGKTLNDVRRGELSLSALFARWAAGKGPDPFAAVAARSALFARGQFPRLEKPDAPEDPWLEPSQVGLLLDRIRCPAEDATRLGALYEQALLLQVVRLTAPAICLYPARVFVAARAVLAQPTAQRAKWLQRKAGLPKRVVHQLADALARARSESDVFDSLTRISSAPAAPVAAGRFVLQAGPNRRRTGTHYTPPKLAQTLVERALGPLVTDSSAEAVRRLRVCDPAAGSGEFLLRAADFLAQTLLAKTPNLRPAELRTHIATRCIHGVDRDPLAIDLARLALTAWATDAGATQVDLRENLRVGNALVGLPQAARSTPECSNAQPDRIVLASLHTAEEAGWTGPATEAAAPFFHWPLEFRNVFNEGGFDAFVGNPPWVAYAGRAAQPLDPALHRYYREQSPAFAGYRTLHGLFVHRCAALTRPGGRLGLLLPTSVADLDGYRATRRAHDALAEVDRELLDFGDGAFEGVFQPCMGLTSSRRTTATQGDGRAWILMRTDLSAAATALLDRLGNCAVLPSQLFGERGYQTTADDLSYLRQSSVPIPPFVTPIREGIDVGEFETREPRVYVDTTSLAGRFRSQEEWRQVTVLIRQTARFPIAARADGVAFRNSIIAGFTQGSWTAARLIGYLNSSLVRWVHFHRHRDARQGMPQVKLGHLRGLPCPGPEARPALERLDAIARDASRQNNGLGETQRQALDEAVFDAFSLGAAERVLVASWARANPLPIARARTASVAEAPTRSRGTAAER